MSNLNRDSIAEKALKLFAERGYEGVGVQEICEASGVTKPTLYHYFKSKRGLLESILESYGKKLLEIIKEALTYEHDFIKSLTRILISEINFANTNSIYFNFHQILLHSPAGSEQQEVFESLKSQIMKIYEEFFILSCNEFGNMRGKEKLYSVLFHNKVVSVAGMCANGELVADDETIYQIIRSTVYGIAN